MAIVSVDTSYVSNGVDLSISRVKAGTPYESVSCMESSL